MSKDNAVDRFALEPTQKLTLKTLSKISFIRPAPNRNVSYMLSSAEIFRQGTHSMNWNPTNMIRRLKLFAVFGLWVCAAILPNRLTAQTVSDSFTTNTAPGWTFGGTTTPILTSGGIDPTGQGWLRLTPNSVNQATYAYYDTPLTAANRTFYGSFDFAIYNGTGADGITFYLYDGSSSFGQGANGGSMGYAQKVGTGGDDHDGKPGGYMAVAIDNWGNFSNPTEGRIGGPGSVPNSVSVRGPGNGTNGYAFIAGTGDGVNPGLDTLTQQLDFPTNLTRPTAAMDYRHMDLVLTPTGQLTVMMTFGTNASVTLFTADLSGYTRPDTLGFGFSAGTGGATEIHEIRNFSLTSTMAQLWDNEGGSSLWGTATNWYPNSVPVAGADIIFDNTYVSTTQNVDLGGTTRSVQSVTLDAPFSYTLSNGTLNFTTNNSLGVLTLHNSGLKGNADQNVAANITTTGDMTINNTASGRFTVSGNLDNNGKVITIAGTGDITMSGVVSGAGRLDKTQQGILTLSGNNTYSGGTTLTYGGIAFGHNNALGTGVLNIRSGSLQASGGSRTISNNSLLEGNVEINGTNSLTFAGIWTQTNGNRTITVNNTALTTFSSNIVLAEANQTRNLTFDVAGGSGGVNVSGVISDGSGSGADGLIKTGTGTLTLSGNNTYTGNTVVSNGVLAIGASDRISDASSVNLAGGTLSLNGSYSEKVNNLSYNNGTLDFGTVGTSNYFLFLNDGTQAGTLAVNNWEINRDRLAVINTNSVSQAFLDNIYFSGYGSGSMTNAGVSVAGYTGTWNPITPLTNGNFFVWDGGGGNNNWSTGQNWNPNGAPTNGPGVKISFEGNTRLSPRLNSSRSINALRFNSNATGSFTLQRTGGSVLTLYGSLPSIMQGSAYNQTIDLPMLLSPSSGSDVIVDTYGAGNLTISGVLGGSGGINKQGSSTLILTGANTNLGATTINGGVINIRNSSALGSTAAGTTVNLGAALELQNNIAVGAEALTLYGTGVSNGGALRNVSGNNSWGGTVTLGSAAQINSDAGLLTLNNGVTSSGKDLTLGGNGRITIDGVLALGSGNLIMNGTSTNTLSGTTANTFTGTTTINSGTLDLNKTAGVTALTGDVTIGDGSGTDTLRLLASNQIADTSTLTLASSGVFNLNGYNETIGGLSSGSIDSKVQLGSGTLTIDNSSYSQFDGIISGTGGLTKSGSNTLTLTGTNTFTGAVTVSEGALNIRSATALGTTAGGVTVASNAVLQVENNITVGSESITLNGSGIGNTGALRNISGNNTLGGTNTLATSSRINSDAGVLTLSGPVTASNRNLTVGGSGDTTISGAITIGTGTLTKDGTGTLTLSGSSPNTFTGATTIDKGTLSVAKAGALANTTSVTINSGGTLLLSGTDPINRINDSATLVMNGGTLNANDKTETMGSMTLAANSVIDLSAGGTAATLTFSGGTYSSGILTINNWTGTVLTSGTDDRIFFSTDPGGAFLANIQFTGFGMGAKRLVTGEIVPIPEPGTTLGGALLLSLLYRRIRKPRKPF